MHRGDDRLVQGGEGSGPRGIDSLEQWQRPARLDQLFRERAFWFFGRGYRTGDMRRLIRQYGRAQANVFPTGGWHKGGNYGTDVNFPVPQAEQNNPSAGGASCLDRNA